MAKGVEDTAFYRWTHLVSLCEVGEPPSASRSPRTRCTPGPGASATSMPTTMTAGSTHDTKRGEDVRARLGVLSQFSAEWVELVGRLQQLTVERRPRGLDGRSENLLWQTLAGTWTEEGPIASGRLAAYLVKASREAKTWTSWSDPDQGRRGGAHRLRHPRWSPTRTWSRALDGWVARDGPRRAGHRPRDQAGAAHPAGCGRRLPGNRVAGDRPRRPRQPRPGRCEQPSPSGCAGWRPAGADRAGPRRREARAHRRRAAPAPGDPRRLRRRARRLPAPAHLHRPRCRVRPDRGATSPGRSPSSAGSPPP